MSLRLKLTLLYTGVLSLVLVVLISLIFVATSHVIYNEVDEGVASKASTVIKSIRVENSPYFLREIVLPDIDVFATPDTYLQAIDLRGQVVAKSGNLGKQYLPLSEETLRSVLNNSFYETVKAGHQEIRVYNVPLIVEGQTVGILQVGRSLSTVNMLLGRLKFFVVAGAAMAIIFAGILGWLMARTALRPVDRIIRIASSIESGGDLSKRIEYESSQDELGRLASTLNAMFGRLEQMYHRLHESYDLQRRFVSDASHELRTPLTTIRGNAELLLKMKNEVPPMAGEALEDIADETRRLSGLLEDLLQLARADAGYQLDLGSLPVDDLVHSVSRKARFLTGNRILAIENKCPPNTRVRGNSDYLSQLMLILLENALKYSPPDSEVTLFINLKDEETVEFAVADRGPGLPPGQEHMIFDRFYRGEHTRGKEGSGLGLAIAHWVVKQHGGTISAANRNGGGSIFTFRLQAATSINAAT